MLMSLPRTSRQLRRIVGLVQTVMVCVATLWLAGPTSAQVVTGEEHCVVNVAPTDSLNVRRLPNSSSRVVNRLRHNACGVIVTGACQGNWCPVEANHDTGWINRRFISMVSPSLYCVAGVATADMLNVRAYPSPQSRVVTRLAHNSCGIAFLPYATQGWQKIRVDGWEGWVNRRFVSGQ